MADHARDHSDRRHRHTAAPDHHGQQQAADAQTAAASGYRVKAPTAYDALEIDEHQMSISLKEKPTHPYSRLAVSNRVGGATIAHVRHNAVWVVPLTSAGSCVAAVAGTGGH